MARYKRYKHGGKNVPGMFKKVQNGNGEGTDTTSTESNVTDKVKFMIEQIKNQKVNQNPFMNVPPGGPTDPNAIKASRDSLMNIQNQKMDSLRREEYKKLQMNQMIQQLQLQNNNLKQQNELLKTQQEKSDLINAARKVKKENIGSSNTPKKHGGKFHKGGSKKKEMFFASIPFGGIMKKGGRTR